MKTKSTFVFLLVTISGAVIGGLIAQLVRDIPVLSFLSYGASFGISMDNPFILDLAVIKLKLGLLIDINIATILGMILALLVYRKLA